LRQDDLEGARYDLEHSIELEPDFSMSHFFLGETLARLHDHAGAKAALDRYRDLTSGG
jgi:hypothetical protein